jgi:hypothetical protein
MEKLGSKCIHIKIGLNHDNGDLRYFFEFQLKEIRLESGFEGAWSDGALANAANALAHKACGLFQWGAVACARIRGQSNPQSVIQHILELKSDNNTLDPLNNAINILYEDSLKQAFPKINNDPLLKYNYKQVVGAIVAAKEPLAIAKIAQFARIEINDVNHLLKNLGCVISVESERGMEIAHISHPSFFDFITNEKCCKNDVFFIDYIQASQMMAMSTLKIMKTGLKFNICGLETSYLMNDAVTNLTSHIKTAIPVHLSYSCHFWAHHIKDTSFEYTLSEEVKSFMEESLLYWLEALSFLKGVSIALEALSIIMKWSEVSFRLNVLFSVIYNLSRIQY